jgi:hypothetical protein
MSGAGQNLDVTSREASWEAVFAEVNSWRGACMHHFSTVEMAVTETLIALSEAAPKGENIRLRQLIGQRFEDLASTIGPGGPFANEGHTAFVALSDYRAKQEAFRALLCHGAIKVTVDQGGQWTLVIRSLSVRSRQAVRGLEVLERTEAHSRLNALKSEGQKLTSLLGQLRKISAI